MDFSISEQPQSNRAHKHYLQLSLGKPLEFLFSLRLCAIASFDILMVKFGILTKRFKIVELPKYYNHFLLKINYKRVAIVVCAWPPIWIIGTTLLSSQMVDSSYGSFFSL